MPVWGWYVIGAGIFIAIFLYLQANKNTPIAQTPSTDQLNAFNKDVSIIGQILNQQQSELGGAAGAPPIQVHPSG